MQMKIYLARHGQDEDNSNGILNGHRDTPLTDIGKDQAHQVATKIQKSGILLDCVYCSPLQRAKKTAEIIIDSLVDNQPKQPFSKKSPPQIDPIVNSDLIERDFGIMAGLPVNEILQRCGEENVLKTETITYFLHPEKAETFDDLIERANRLLSNLSVHHDSNADSILLVTHGDFGKMLYAAYYNLAWKDVLQQFHFGNSEVLLLSNESSPDCAKMFEIQQYNS